MRRLICALLCLLPALPATAALPPVYLYHDGAYASYGYLQAPKGVTLSTTGVWPVAPGDTAQQAAYHRGIMEALEHELKAAGVACEPLDAEGWLALCRSGRRAIVIDICQTVPDTVFSGQRDGSPLETWLDGGGILVYSGDWPFYWYCDRSGKISCEGAGPGGDDAIFDVDLVQPDMVGIVTAATPRGAEALPTLRGTWTLRPFNLAAVEQSCSRYEVYLQGERLQDGVKQRAADALSFDLPHGTGSFTAFHLLRGSHGDTAQVILEFMTGRAQALYGGETR